MSHKRTGDCFVGTCEICNPPAQYQNNILAELQAQVRRYKTALHEISLSSQNSMSDKAEAGRIARAALRGEKV